MPIILAPLDQELTIVKILAGDKDKKHLESLGILPNSKVKVLSKVNGGVVLNVKDTRLALDKVTASKILVA